MQTEKQQRVPLESEIEGSQFPVSNKANVVIAGFGEKEYSLNDSDSFYGKLSELLESSGLSLAFNVREAILDLFLFYMEVTRRGGYHQVTVDKKWDEVVSALKLDGGNVKVPAQLKKLYANLLYQFEKIHHYRERTKQSEARHNITGELSPWDTSTTKQNSGASSSQSSADAKDDPVKKKKKTSKENSCLSLTVEGAPGTAELKLSRQILSKDKEMKKHRSRGATRGKRTAYQIFIKKECARLKTSHQEILSGSNVLHLAIETWRNMSEGERQPYFEESRKENEKFMQEMASCHQQQTMQNTKDGKRPCPDRDYHPTLQPNGENSGLPNQQTVELALTMMKNAHQSPELDINWDAYLGSLDIPTEESK
ncbi:High mobility group B protein like [Quillaja saponaria]|uniref:High mobility group B protein like n=1 Tax=Quillaja saponaria TaxID=32244 RepID=A0AAD7QAE3_QUISA|nr:High mobility group B protein like [Quillaja saponaria]